MHAIHVVITSTTVTPSSGIHIVADTVGDTTVEEVGITDVIGDMTTDTDAETEDLECVTDSTEAIIAIADLSDTAEEEMDVDTVTADIVEISIEDVAEMT